MARFSHRQIITAISVVFLAALTAVAGWALHRINTLSLPIPNVQSALTLALPALGGIVLETLISFQSSLAAKGVLQYSKTFQAITALFLIYETVLATLAGSRITPLGGLWCPLHGRWQELYHRKDATHIQRIQDALKCCGFATTKDMAWPFPEKGRGTETCVVRYERDQACLPIWRGEERNVAIMLLIVPLGVFLWKLALFLGLNFESNWLPSTIQLPNESSNSHDRSRPAIMYRDIEQQSDEASLRREVDSLNKDSNLATHVESGRHGPRVVASPLIQQPGNGWMSD